MDTSVEVHEATEYAVAFVRRRASHRPDSASAAQALPLPFLAVKDAVRYPKCMLAWSVSNDRQMNSTPRMHTISEQGGGQEHVLESCDSRIGAGQLKPEPAHQALVVVHSPPCFNPV